MKKKAEVGDQIMVVAFFMVIAIIAAGMIAGIYIYSSEGHDTRTKDSSVLNYKLARCISDKEINWNLEKNSQELEEQIFTNCQLNEKATKEYFVLKIERNSELKYDWAYDEVTCVFGKEESKFVQCTEKTLTIKDQEFKITTGSRQVTRREI